MDLHWLRYLRTLFGSDDSGDISFRHYKNTRTLQSGNYKITDEPCTAKEQNIKHKILSNKVEGRSHKVTIETDNYSTKPKLYNMGIGIQ